VYLPHALERKYPSAAKEWGWQYVFPARDVSTTMIYTHVLQQGGQGVPSPLDDLNLGGDSSAHEQLVEGTVDQLPLFGLVLAGLAGDGLCRSGYLKLLDSAFHHLRCGFVRSEAFSVALSHAVWTCSGLRPTSGRMILVLGFPPRAICAEIT
jgi:hypothetical protein